MYTEDALIDKIRELEQENEKLKYQLTQQETKHSLDTAALQLSHEADIIVHRGQKNQTLLDLTADLVKMHKQEAIQIDGDSWPAAKQLVQLIDSESAERLGLNKEE